jgi:endonuclease-3 related protein
MPPLDESFPTIVSALADRYGQPAFVAEGLEPFEAMLAVVLARSVEVRKIAPALAALADAGRIDPPALAGAAPAEIVAILRDEAGLTSAAKLVGPIQRLAKWVVDRHHGEAASLLDDDLATPDLREQLTALKGIGPATADAILLFALRRPAYPVDRATYRILIRHGWLDTSADYEETRSLVEGQCGDDPALLARLSEWFERIGREYCRPSVAKCERCPLRPVLGEGGPREPEG